MSWTAVLSFGWLAAPRASSDHSSRDRIVEQTSDSLALSAPVTDTALNDARDAEWMVRVGNGDVEAFRALFEAYAATLLHIATGYVRAPDLAQDVVQDVFLTIWERRDSLVITGRVAAYLGTATRNRALKVVRSFDRMSRREAEVAREQTLSYPVPDTLGDSSVESDAFYAALRDAIAAMPSRQREVLLLHREQGLDYATIAATLGVSVPSVYNTMSRALARLRTALSEFL